MIIAKIEVGLPANSDFNSAAQEGAGKVSIPPQSELSEFPKYVVSQRY